MRTIYVFPLKQKSVCIQMQITYKFTSQNRVLPIIKPVCKKLDIKYIFLKNLVISCHNVLLYGLVKMYGLHMCLPPCHHWRCFFPNPFYAFCTKHSMNIISVITRSKEFKNFKQDGSFSPYIFNIFHTVCDLFCVGSQSRNQKSQQVCQQKKFNVRNWLQLLQGGKSKMTTLK